MVSLLSWRNAVSVYQIWADQCADELDAFFNEVDGGTVQIQLVAPTDIADQSAYLIDPGANRYVVALIMIM